MNLVMFGAPGSGKGTQCQLLHATTGIAHLSTGDMLRAEVARGTAAGREAEGYMSRGSLVPDRLIVEAAEAAVLSSKVESGFVLDGFPRNLAQAQALEAALAAAGRRLDAVISLKIPTHALVRRLSGRRVCSLCGRIYNVQVGGDEASCAVDGGRLVRREDDRPEAVRRRLDVYLAETAPVLEFYATRGLLVKIDASRPVAEVQANIARKLSALAAC